MEQWEKQKTDRVKQAGKQIEEFFFLSTSQVVLVVKNLPSNAGDIRDTGLSPGLGR